MTGAISFASRYDDVRSLFLSNGAEVSANGGVKIIAREEGAGVTFRDEVSGVFTLDLSLDTVANNGLKTIEIVYTDANDSSNVIKSYVEVENKKQSFYTLINGKKYGIYYDNGVQAGKTVSQNSIGNYTISTGSNRFTLSFNPTSMKLVANGYLTWDYSSVSVDGAYTGVTKEGFEKYKVAISVSEISYGIGQFTINSVNGCSLSNQYIANDNDKPGIFADVKINALTDSEYAVPMPTTYDLCDGNISADKVSVKVVSPSGKVLLDQKWSEGAKFVPEEEGEYALTYSVQDSVGNKGSVSFTVKAYRELTPNKITYANKVREGEFGTGATHLIPSAICQNDMYVFDKEIIPFVEISRDGKVKFERRASENFTYTFSTSGEYTIRYYVKERGYKIYSESYSLSIKDSLPALSYNTLSSEYVLNGLVEIPDASVLFGNSSAPAKITVISPSGRYIADKTVKLDEIGEYTVEYFAEIDGKEYVVKEKFNSIYAPEDIFQSSAGLSVSFATNPYEEKVKGLLVTSLANVEATFNNVVKLDELTKEDLLIGIQAIPKQVGEVEYNKMYITLTDTENSANYIRIFIYGANQNYLSYAKVSFNGSKEIGWALDYFGTGGNIVSSKTSGLNLRHSFKGLFEQGHDLSDGVIDVYFDWSEKAFYAGNAYNGFVSGVKLLADLDDPEWTAAFGKEWTGFTNNTAYLSVSYGYREKSEINWWDLGSYYSSAQYIITGAAGMDFTQMTTRDTLAPTIFVDVPQKVSSAILNQKYKVFDAIAIDNITENVYVDKKVVLNYGAENYLDVEIVDGYFTPVYSGTYEIIYSAKDGFGNITSARVPINTVESVDPITTSLGDMGSYLEGVEGVLPSITAFGGVGNYTVSLTLTSPSGKDCMVNADNTFLPVESGEYKAVYTVKDYVGNEKVERASILVQDNDAPVFDSAPVMPVVMTAGVPAEIPSITATDYATATPSTVRAKVYVKYASDDDYSAEIVGETFTPDSEKIGVSGENITFKYEAQGEKGVNVKEINVPVAKMNMTSGYIKPSEYFVTSNPNMTLDYGDSKGRGVKVIASTQGDNVIFGKKILAKGLSVGFTINEKDDKNNLTQLSFEIIDSVNSDISIKFSLRRNYKDNYFMMTDGNKLRPNVTLDNYTGTFSFNVETNIGKIQNAQAKAIKCVNGDDFNGFPSGYVFIKMTVADFRSEKVESYEDVNQNGEQDVDEPDIMVDGKQGFFIVNSIGIQNFNSTGRDNVAPTLHVLGSYGGGAVVNQDYVIPRAIAGDVLSTWQEVKVTVKNPNGAIVSAKDGTILNGAPAIKDYVVNLNLEGNYTIQYQVKDANNNSPLSPPVNLLVKSSLDRVAVTLSISGIVPESAKVDTDVILPTASVVGSNGLGQYVLITVFDEQRNMVGVTNNTFKPTKAGNYLVVYTGYDSNGNAIVERFSLKVTK